MHRLNLIVLSCALALSAPLVGQDSRPASWPPARTTASIKKAVDAGFWTGVSMAAIDGKNESATGFGRLAASGDVKVNAATQFEIGSISKVFTALLLAHAIEEKKLNMSDTLGALLGKEHKLSESAAAITLEELATHTSGLPRMPSNFEPASNDDPYTDYSREKLFRYLAGAKIPAEARGKVSYSNLGMGLLGTLLELRLGADYGELVTRVIAGPLKMKATAPSAGSENTAAAHSGPLPASSWDFDALAGAGDLVSTADDMLRFARFCLSSGETPLHRALKETVRRRFEIQPGMSIGLGWHAAEQEGRRVVWHNGGTGGFSSFLGFEPATGKALFLVANSNNPDITNLGLNAFYDSIPDPISRIPKVVALKAEEHTKCEGRYELTGGLILDVRFADERLTVTIPGQPTYVLYPTAANEYFLAAAPVRCHFIPGKTGAIEALMWSQGGSNQRAQRVPEPEKTISMTSEQLATYVGEYELKKGLIFTVFVKDGGLRARLSGQPALPVYPTSKSRFIYKVIHASLEFEFDDDGKTTALTLDQAGRQQRCPRIK